MTSPLRYIIAFHTGIIMYNEYLYYIVIELKIKLFGCVCVCTYVHMGVCNKLCMIVDDQA